MKTVLTYKFNTLIALCFILSLWSCEEEPVVQLNTTPLIQFISVSSTDVLQFKDSLVVVFEYKDGDGDIGETDPDKNSIQVQDSRLVKPDFYFIQPLSPPGSSIKTSGTIVLNLKSPFLIGTADSEKAIFEIRIKDREGNWSNLIQTPEITIRR